MAQSVRIPVSSDDLSADFFAAAFERRWTDGLPVIPPTPDRVNRMLAAVERDPDEIVAIMPPRQGPASVRSIAANAVMAGCLPEYFPVVLAAVEAINDPMFPLGTLAGLRPETPFFLVNGPIREKIQLNCGRGCLGPGWRANATIGRAIRLIMINIGGFSPGEYARTCFSSPMQYAFCAGEDEAGSPWEPFHVERGFRKEQSVVTVFRVTSYIALLAPLDWDQSPKGLLEHTGLSMVSLGNTGLYAGSLSCLVLFNPERVRLLADAGISKADAKTMLWEYTLLPSSYFRKGDLKILEKKGCVVAGRVSLVDRPEDIYIGVMGGTGIHTVFLPGFSHEIIPHVPVSKVIP
ncbi:MAG: hypothetical protein HYY45_08670 [Deltaproteobacteria bacterium]|nr:hypothetical protein [Deltaproteobacteria bacterium]